MIYTFSGTGNSFYTADRIAAGTGDPVTRINALIRSSGCASLTPSENLVFVTPTYAWQIPHIVRDWILKTDFPEAKNAWFVMTCGDGIGNAGSCNRSLCDQKGFRYMGTARIVMPENYIAMFPVPGPEKARQIIAQANPDIDRAAEQIKKEEAFPAVSADLLGRLYSGPINSFFYRFCIKADAFRTTDACTGCGTCVHSCPTDNIRLENGRPVWGKDCTHCMACICGCPAEAIEYGKASIGKPRYHCDP